LWCPDSSLGSDCPKPNNPTFSPSAGCVRQAGRILPSALPGVNATGTKSPTGQKVSGICRCSAFARPQ